MKIIRLPYSDNITTIFGTIASYPWSIWLDSGAARTFNQRYDIISGFPYKTYTSNLTETHVEHFRYSSKDGKILQKSFQKQKIDHQDSNTDPISIINKALSNLTGNYKQKNSCTTEIPFWHGALGYFGYDLNQLIFKQLAKNQQTEEIPVCAIGFYPWAITFDHHLRCANLVYDPKYVSKKVITAILELFCVESSKDIEKSKGLETLKDINTSRSSGNSSFPVNSVLNLDIENRISCLFSSTKFTSTINLEQYKANFDKIKKHINHGDCYQINYALPFELACSSEMANIPNHSWHVYQYLKKQNSNPFGCYFKLDDQTTIMSFSPERFLKLSDNVIKAEPIKGTRARTTDHVQDRQNKNQLLNSKKDRAENMMIVDLMRNDLNKLCIPGTVVVEQICGLHSFPTVHHLISTISGKIDCTKTSALDIFAQCFPGGSITGAPKLRAMQIIQNLENANDENMRFVYCGSIGYFNIDGSMDTNIAIRTAVLIGDRLKYWAGSGVVADSEAESEFQEIFNKLIKID